GPTLVELGSCLRDARDEECFEWFRRAIDAAREDGRLPMAAFAHSAMSKAQLMWGEPEVARLHAREALSIARRCGCWGFAARAAKRAADAAVALSDPMRAAWYYSEALSLHRRVGTSLLPEARSELRARVGTGTCSQLDRLDLPAGGRSEPAPLAPAALVTARAVARSRALGSRAAEDDARRHHRSAERPVLPSGLGIEIGRASCREIVWSTGVGE